MGHIVPADISRLALSGVHRPELDTLNHLKANLSDDYTIFHGVHWTREYRGWTHFGEIDFVVLNRSGDVLFIEQKNGVLEGQDGSLVKVYEDGAKDPVVQVRRSIEKVLEKFQWQHGKTRRLQVDYLIYLPDFRIRDINAVGLDRSRIVDSTAGEKLFERISALLGPGVQSPDGWLEKVHDFFCQSFQVVPDIQAHRDAHAKTFVRQVGAVADILSNLEMEPFRLRFKGAAGSGKSLIGRNFYDRCLLQGKRVLLTCFNRPLAMRLRESVAQGGYVDTFHGFCVEFLKCCGHPPDFHETDVWRRIPELVTAESISADWLFDALIVDEGQDFDQEWFDVLTLFLRPDADILWLEDPIQDLQDKPPVETSNFVGFRCHVNYRSPESIARFIRNTLPFHFEPGNDLPGLGVGVHTYTSPDQQPKIVTRVIQDLIRRGFTYHDIVIVTCRGAQNSAFSKVSDVGGVKLRRFTGSYDQDGTQIMTDGQLLVESIYRFKGQEAPAVILVDVDPREDRLDREQRVLFCGMTRATVRLELIVCMENPANQTLIEGGS